MAKSLKLSEVIQKIQSGFPGFQKRWSEAQTVSRWDEAVGSAIAKHTRVRKVENQVLWVEVDHPIWKKELHHRKRQILEVLNQKNVTTSSGETIKDLFFVDPLGSFEPK